VYGDIAVVIIMRPPPIDCIRVTERLFPVTCLVNTE